MLLTASTMFALIHVAPSGGVSVSCWPQGQRDKHTNDAASGV